MLIAIIFFANLSSCKNNDNSNEEKVASLPEANLKLPEGFSASIIADSLGKLRHMIINKNGDIYVKLSALRDGDGIYFLSDTDHNGSLDKTTGFGDYPGTGIRIKNGYLYSASNSAVYRYKLNDKEEVDTFNEAGRNSSRAC